MCLCRESEKGRDGVGDGQPETQARDREIEVDAGTSTDRGNHV